MSAPGSFRGPRAVGVCTTLISPAACRGLARSMPLACNGLYRWLQAVTYAVRLVNRDVRVVVVVGGGAAAVGHHPPAAPPHMPDPLPVDDVHDAEPPGVLHGPLGDLLAPPHLGGRGEGAAPAEHEVAGPAQRVLAAVVDGPVTADPVRHAETLLDEVPDQAHPRGDVVRPVGELRHERTVGAAAGRLVQPVDLVLVLLDRLLGVLAPAFEVRDAVGQLVLAALRLPPGLLVTVPHLREARQGGVLLLDQVVSERQPPDQGAPVLDA